jgi:hypothetical protein
MTFNEKVFAMSRCLGSTKCHNCFGLLGVKVQDHACLLEDGDGGASDLRENIQVDESAAQ